MAAEMVDPFLKMLPTTPATNRKSTISLSVTDLRKTAVIHQHGRDDARRTVGRCGDDAAKGCIFLIDGHGKAADELENPRKIHPALPDQANPFPCIGSGKVAEQLLSDPVGAPAYLKTTGQVTGGVAAAEYGLPHNLPNVQEAGIDLGMAAPGALVAAHHPGNGQPLSSTVVQQVFSFFHRPGELNAGPGSRFAFFDHKTASHRIVGGFAQKKISRAVGLKFQAVGVKGQALGKVKNNIRVRIKGDGLVAAQGQALFPGDTGRKAIDLLQGHRNGVAAAQTQQQGDIRTVPFPGQGQRTVQLYAHPLDMVVVAGVLKFLNKTLGGPPGTQRMGAGRPNADLQHVEDANWFHGSGIAI